MDYLNLYAIPSVITGEKIPVLAEGDAVISNYKARAIFGDSNPVGKKIIVGIQGEYVTFIIRDVFEVSNIEQGVRCDTACPISFKSMAITSRCCCARVARRSN